jgi:hypothetical protein
LQLIATEILQSRRAWREKSVGDAFLHRHLLSGRANPERRKKVRPQTITIVLTSSATNCIPWVGKVPTEVGTLPLLASVPGAPREILWILMRRAVEARRMLASSDKPERVKLWKSAY